MNPLDALVAASDRLVALLQPIATEFERFTSLSAYRLAAFLYRACIFLLAGSAVIGATRRVVFIAGLVQLGANPWVFAPRLIRDGLILAISFLAKIFVDRWVVECGRLADKAEGGSTPLGNSMREHPFHRAQSLFLIVIAAQEARWLFDLSPTLLGCFCDVARALWPILAILACHFHACQSTPRSPRPHLRPNLAQSY